jgi:hypothetical protein
MVERSTIESVMGRQTLVSLCERLRRYAGWLDRKNVLTVQADIHALAMAIETNADAMPLLAVLESTLSRLPSGEVRRMMRVMSREIREALDEPR